MSAAVSSRRSYRARNLPNPPPWSDAEIAILREHYPLKGPACIGLFPGRTVSALKTRALILGVNFAPKQWRPAQDKILRRDWGVVSIADLSKQLGHCETSVYLRARKLGIKVGVPQGMEHFTHAAKRTGFCYSTLWRILDYAGIKAHLAFTRPHTPSPRGHRHLCVDPFEVDEAVALWLSTEPVQVAANRRGLVPYHLRTALQKEGVPRRRAGHGYPWRVPSDVIDRVVAKYRLTPRAVPSP